MTRGEMGERDRKRLYVALAVAIACGCVAGLGRGIDIYWPLEGARRLLAGENPYLRPYDIDPKPGFLWQYYPLPALILCMPFAWMPNVVAKGVIMGCASGLLTWVLYPHKSARWSLLSYAFVLCLMNTQPWPLLAAAALFEPRLAPLALCKPNLALPVLVSRPRWNAWPVVVAGLLCAISVPLGWFQHVSAHENMTAIALVFGAPLVLALANFRVSWRNRCVALMACMPVRPYDYMLLSTLGPTPRRSMLMALCTWLLPVLGGFSPNPWQVVLAFVLPSLLALSLPIPACLGTRMSRWATPMFDDSVSAVQPLNKKSS